MLDSLPHHRAMEWEFGGHYQCMFPLLGVATHLSHNAPSHFDWTINIACPRSFHNEALCWDIIVFMNRNRKLNKY